jgi:hypothetical protein
VTDEKLLISALSFGAREVKFDRPVPAQLLGDAMNEANLFFGHGGDGLEAWRWKVRALGVTPRMSPGEIRSTIANAFSVRPDASEAKDRSASEAWALEAFASIDWTLRSFKDGTFVLPPDMDAAAMIERQTALLGQIMGWWRWRNEGYDLMAVKEKAAMADRDRGAAANRARAASKKAFANRLAAEIKPKFTKGLSKSELARRVREHWGEGAPSESTIRNHYLR